MNREATIEATTNEPVKRKSERYPRNGWIRLLRTVLLWAWGLITWYFGNGLRNLFQLAVAHPDKLRHADAVVQALALPGFLGNQNVPEWVYVLLGGLAFIIVAGCIWALIDRWLEARAVKKQGPRPVSPDVQRQRNWGRRLVITLLAGLVLGVLTVPLLIGIELAAQAIVAFAVTVATEPNVDIVIFLIVLSAAYLFLLGRGLWLVVRLLWRNTSLDMRREEEAQREREYRYRRMLQEREEEALRGAERDALRYEAQRARREEAIERAERDVMRRQASALIHDADIKVGLALVAATLIFLSVLVFRMRLGILPSDSPWSNVLQVSAYVEIAIYPLVLVYSTLCSLIHETSRAAARVKSRSMREALVYVLAQALCAVVFALSLMLI